MNLEVLRTLHIFQQSIHSSTIIIFTGRGIMLE